MPPVIDEKLVVKEERVLVEKYNAVKVRHALDDAMKATFAKMGWVEDYTHVDVKLALEAVAVAFAGVGLYISYFHTGPQVDMVLGVCVVMYFLLSGILQAYQFFVVKTITMQTNKGSQKVIMRSLMEKSPPHLYTFSIEWSDGTKHPKPAKSTVSIGKFIDVNGYVHNQKIETEVSAVLAGFNKT
ncbi:hypothetical protein SARC_05277 [Sphaeroforma arctica JP610]|uniref:Signal peptidase complex subunit 2 n=1 Tax=Sphaeroforma arctica JP610 TaxID=667725 RepID=A0A0L0G046_9EUKA|nr:hypothetical protein SARC_05277 [Sphaeroforma arctica JP610]KNC82445.1 hypothetical protein SARC_05277 [Sphaeroforma arctica JP610]|eukprot:XP_014156347.1 hypothetical protein SARC_05277 [Sphaeroforma arctica JP610]